MAGNAFKVGNCCLHFLLLLSQGDYSFDLFDSQYSDLIGDHTINMDSEGTQTLQVSMIMLLFLSSSLSCITSQIYW